MKEITFLSIDNVMLLHSDTIAMEGGQAGLRDHGLLDSAVAMPRQQFGGVYLHKDLPAMTAAYLFHVAQNHPFYDGNKRTAAMAVLAFLRLNDVSRLPEPQKLEIVTRQVAAGELSKDELTDWVRRQIAGKARRSSKRSRHGPTK
jgi:death-on-curing protein